MTADRPDADDLVVRAALGEPLTADERERLAADPDLRAEVARLAEVVALAEEAPDDVVDDASLDHLWAGIAAEAFGPGHGTMAPDRPTRADAEADTDEADTHEADTPGADTDVAEVVPLRRRPVPWVGLAAAAVVAVLVALLAVGPFGGDDPAPVAVAELAPFADAPVDAVRGRFVATDGTAVLELDLSSLPDQPDAFYEVWLLDEADGRLVSLGPVRPDGTYALPQGTEVGDYPTVDVSVEPQDGDPTHSGDSVLRGPVRA